MYIFLCNAPCAFTHTHYYTSDIYEIAQLHLFLYAIESWWFKMHFIDETPIRHNAKLWQKEKSICARRIRSGRAVVVIGWCRQCFWHRAAQLATDFANSIIRWFWYNVQSPHSTPWINVFILFNSKWMNFALSSPLGWQQSSSIFPRECDGREWQHWKCSNTLQARQIHFSKYQPSIYPFGQVIHIGPLDRVEKTRRACCRHTHTWCCASGGI